MSTIQNIPVPKNFMEEQSELSRRHRGPVKKLDLDTYTLIRPAKETATARVSD